MKIILGEKTAASLPISVFSSLLPIETPKFLLRHFLLPLVLLFSFSNELMNEPKQSLSFFVGTRKSSRLTQTGNSVPRAVIGDMLLFER